MMHSHQPTPSYPIRFRNADHPVTTPQPASPPPHVRKTPRIVAFGFLFAFGMTILTVLLTGLWVRAPHPRTDPASESGLDTVTLELNERRTVNLLFASRTALDDVLFLIDLPSGVELRGYEGSSRIEWSARLEAGDNLLPLDLVATTPRGGSLVARLTHGSRDKTFVVTVAVGPG